MKTLLKIIAVVLLLLVGGALGFGRYKAGQARDKVAEQQQKLAKDWETFAPQITLDETIWKNDPLIAARDGGDAAPLLFQHVRWDHDGKPPPVPEALTSAIRANESSWAQHANDYDLAGVDTSWMKGLDAYGYWDLYAQPGPLTGKPWVPMTEAQPNFLDAQSFAKVHLLQGLKAGDARGAAREVRELARLLLTTENLVGEMVGSALLGIERRVHEEAVHRKHDVTGWKPVAEADQNALRRLIWAMTAVYTIHATGPVASSEVRVGACGALQVGLDNAYFTREYLRDELPDHYARLERELKSGRCRLTRARDGWFGAATEGQLPLNGEALCTEDKSGAECRFKGYDWVFRVPFVKPFIGNTLAGIAMPDWLRYYRPTPEPERT